MPTQRGRYKRPESERQPPKWRQVGQLDRRISLGVSVVDVAENTNENANLEFMGIESEYSDLDGAGMLWRRMVDACNFWWRTIVTHLNT